MVSLAHRQVRLSRKQLYLNGYWEFNSPAHRQSLDSQRCWLQLLLAKANRVKPGCEQSSNLCKPAERLVYTVPSVPCDLERWPSGLRHHVGSVAYPQGCRGFESLPLRHWWAWYMGKSGRLENDYASEMGHWQFDSAVHRQILRAWLELADAGALKALGAKAPCRFDPCRSHQVWTGLRRGAGSYKALRH